MKKLLLFFLVLFSASECFAFDISGLALINLKNKKMSFSIDQAVILDDEGALFVGIDDFGGELFKLDFKKTRVEILSAGKIYYSKKNTLKRIISLPLTREEFLSLFYFKAPDTFKVVENTWVHTKYKGLKIIFKDFIDIKGKSIPKGFEITYKRNLFEFQWVSLK